MFIYVILLGSYSTSVEIEVKSFSEGLEYISIMQSKPCAR